jgi:ABC-2 type transport system permease protein
MSAQPTATSPARPLSWRAELGRQLRRRRTVWSFALVLALPLILIGAFAFGDRGVGTGPRLVDLATLGSANFTAFTVFGAADFLLIVLAAQFAGDSVPAEASWSTLRYLLAAPVPRARLLSSKLVVAVGTTVVAVVALPVWSLLVGGLAYGWAPFTTTGAVSFGWVEFLARLALGAGVIAVTLLQVCGIAFLIGTLTDAPLGAVGGAVLVTIVSSILNSVEALGDWRNGLPMHYSRAWFQALSPEIGWQDIQRGMLWSCLYAVLTGAAAYLVFRRKDILS